MRPETMDPDASWNDIAPLLEAAVTRLAKQDRDAVLLRFYEQKPLAEVGRLLGVSEEAARKRVDRAVAKLRERLATNGIEVETGSLAGLMLAHVAEGGPAGLVGKVMEGMANGTAGGIAQGAARMMALTKAKVVAGLLVAAAAIGVVGAGLLPGQSAPTEGTPAGNVPAGMSAQSPAAAALKPSELQRIYELLYVLRHAQPGTEDDQWCSAIMELAGIGKPAVPYVVAELDRSPNGNHNVRALVFTLRAIGDPRAVPALLRAMPQCTISTSDYGIKIVDPQLLEFMVRNSIQGQKVRRPDGTPFGNMCQWSRPVVEIDAALRKLTRHSEGRDYLLMNPFGQTPAEQEKVRDAYRSAAGRWQKWWDQNRVQLVSDQELKTLVLAPVEGDPIEAAGSALPKQTAEQESAASTAVKALARIIAEGQARAAAATRPSESSHGAP